MSVDYLICCSALLLFTVTASAQTLRASCQVAVNNGTGITLSEQVTGNVAFTQLQFGTLFSTLVTVTLSGFSTTDSNTNHGFHVHAIGDLSNGCQSTGGHYNPASSTHGSLSSTVRHVGDMGNLVETATGTVSTTFSTLLRLDGPQSIIGRAVVVHALQDDLGLGGNAGSESTGNAGGRLSCCLINLDSGAICIRSMSLLLIPLSVLVTLLMTGSKTL